MTGQTGPAANDLLALAERKDFDGVRGAFREHPPSEVLAAADRAP